MTLLELQVSYVFVGAVTGFIVGCSGVGGGAIMTPALILLGIDPVTAVGTDLIFSFITKSTALRNYHTQKNINWRIVKQLCIGSVPATLLVLWILNCIHDTEAVNHLIKFLLGYVLLLVAFLLLLKNILGDHTLKINQGKSWAITEWIQHHLGICTILCGFFLGAIVTFTSIGAGSIGVVLIYALYYRLPTIQIVGTDIAQALFITFIAGIGHGFQGHVDYNLLLFLLTGSIPAILLSSYYTRYLPERFIRTVLIMVLVITGLRFIFH